MIKIPHSSAALRVTFLSGFMLLVLIGGILAGIYTTVGRAGFGGAGGERGFDKLLEDYDYKYRRITEAAYSSVQRQEFDELCKDLDRLEKKAWGVESWLSILKRRRQLAAVDSRYAQNYRQSSRHAADSFPHSEPLAAVASAALVHDTAITADGEKELRAIIPLLASSRYASMRLGLHVLLGDFKTPRQAVESLPKDSYLPSGLSSWENAAALTPGNDAILTDLLIFNILTGNSSNAETGIQAVLTAAPAPGLIRLAAEYYYDFGSLIRSAELFSMLPGDDAMSRQADALWLAGYAGSARTIWEMLKPIAISDASGPNVRVVYNLALTAPDQDEAAALLRELAGQGGTADASGQYGLIRYSRLLDASAAISTLDAGRDPGTPAEALIDLEILKRRIEIAESARITAETWLLLDRYPDEENLYQWGAWYFDLHRRYDETALLMKIAARNGFSGNWMGLHEALRQLREGDPDAAENFLASAGGWAADANRGRILEARRAPIKAIENYEKAAAEVIANGGYDNASRIQLRIAHCWKTLGRPDECRSALEYALDLNPDNLNARLELGRLYP